MFALHNTFVVIKMCTSESNSVPKLYGFLSQIYVKPLFIQAFSKELKMFCIWTSDSKLYFWLNYNRLNGFVATYSESLSCI